METNKEDNVAISSVNEKQFDVSNILADYFKDKIRQGIGVGDGDECSQTESEDSEGTTEEKGKKRRLSNEEQSCEDEKTLKKDRSKKKKKKKKKKKHKQHRRSRSRSPFSEERRLSKESDKASSKGSSRTKHKVGSPLRETKHQTRSRDREKILVRGDVSRSRSRSRHRSKSRKRRTSGRRERRRSRSRSKDRRIDRSSGRFRSPLRGRELSGRGGRSARSEADEETTEVGAVFDKKELLEVARRNVKVMIQTGTLPKGIDVVKLGLNLSKEETSSAAESVGKFTEICRKIQETGDDDESASTPRVSHPFQVKERPIRMNIPNAVQLPAKSFQEKIKDTAALTAQFPVSSGSTHRKNEIKELDWKPVTKENAAQESKELKDSAGKTIKEEFTVGATILSNSSSCEATRNVLRPVLTVAPTTQSVAPNLEESLRSMTIPQVMTRRVEALQKLQKDPTDLHARQLHEATENVIRQWSLSKQQPGQLTNSVDKSVKFLSPAELQEGPQAWVKKDQLQKARAVEGGIGMALLQKMGWTPGTALGKNREGTLEPLLPPIKMDRKGLVAQEESIAKDISVNVLIPNRTARGNAMLQEVQASSLGGKHPVSALIELCTAQKVSAPEFVELPAFGPDHKKTFLYRVNVNGKSYQPLERSPNKKLAKAAAALVALNEMGVVVGIEKAPRMSLMPQGTEMPLRPPGVSAEEPSDATAIFQPLKCTDPSKMASSFFTSFHVAGLPEDTFVEASGTNQTQHSAPAPQAIIQDNTFMSSYPAALPPHSLWSNFRATSSGVDQMQYDNTNDVQKSTVATDGSLCGSNDIPLMVPPPTDSSSEIPQ